MTVLGKDEKRLVDVYYEVRLQLLYLNIIEIIPQKSNLNSIRFSLSCNFNSAIHRCSKVRLSTYLYPMWDSEEHKQNVLEFVVFLRQKGFNANIDRNLTQNETMINLFRMMHENYNGGVSRFGGYKKMS